ncbi:MAG: GntR family transcriptional regulator, partial [Anaerolineales bacterium]
ELSQAYGVGRHTIREALSRLVADSIITRRAGMGTVVNTPQDRTRFYLDRSFSHQMAAMGRDAHSHVLDKHTGTLTKEHPAPLHGHLGKPFFYLQRLRFGDDEPIGIQASYLLSERCPGIENEDFHDASLYDVLASKYEIVITQIDHTVTAETATALQIVLLQTPPTAALLGVKTVAYVHDKQLIEFTQSFYRADRYEYKTSSLFGA